MQRRKFLLSGLGGLSALGAWLWFGQSSAEAIEMVVRQRLDYLKLDPEGLRRFARDTVARNALSRARIHLLSVMRPVYQRAALSSADNSLARLLRHGEDRVVSSFLICSDFFVSGADVSRIVRYRGLLDSRTACVNPFARRPA